MLTRGKAKQTAPAAEPQDIDLLVDRLCQFEAADTDILEVWQNLKKSYNAAPPESAFESGTIIDAVNIELSPQPLDTRPQPLPFCLWVSQQLPSTLFSKACRLEHSVAVAAGGKKDKVAHRLASLASRLHCDPAVFYECFGPKIAFSRDVITNLQELVNIRPDIRLLDLATAYHKERVKAQPKSPKAPVRKPATIIRYVIKKLTPDLRNVTFRRNRCAQTQNKASNFKQQKKQPPAPRQSLSSEVPEPGESRLLQHNFNHPDSEQPRFQQPHGDTSGADPFCTQSAAGNFDAADFDPCQNDDLFDDSIEKSRGDLQARIEHSAIEERFLAHDFEREENDYWFDENYYDYGDLADKNYISNTRHTFTPDSCPHHRSFLPDEDNLPTSHHQTPEGCRRRLPQESSINLQDSSSSPLLPQHPSHSPQYEAEDLSVSMSFCTPVQHGLKRPFSLLQEGSENSRGSSPMFRSFPESFSSSSKGCTKPSFVSPKRQKSVYQLGEGSSACNSHFLPSMDWRCLSEKNHITDAIIQHFLVALRSAEVGVVDAFLSNAELKDGAQQAMELQAKNIVLIPHQANGIWRLFVVRREQSLLQEFDPTNTMSDIGKKDVLPQLQQLFRASSLTDVKKVSCHQVGQCEHDSGIVVIAFATAIARNGSIDALGPIGNPIDGVAWRHHLQHRLLRGRALPVWVQRLSPSLPPPPVEPTSYCTAIHKGTLVLMRKLWAQQATLKAMEKTPGSIEAACARSKRLLIEARIGLATVNSLHAMHISAAQSARRAWKGLQFDAIAFNVLDQLNNLCSLYRRADEILQSSAYPATPMSITPAQMTSLRMAAVTASEAAKE